MVPFVCWPLHGRLSDRSLKVSSFSALSCGFVGIQFYWLLIYGRTVHLGLSINFPALSPVDGGLSPEPSVGVPFHSLFPVSLFLTVSVFFPELFLWMVLN